MKLRYESVGRDNCWGVVKGNYFYGHREDGPSLQRGGHTYLWYLGHTLICETRIP